MIESPCLGICTILNGKCIGCNRTSEEITDWLFYSEKQRSVITKRCLKEIEDKNNKKS